MKQGQCLGINAEGFRDRPMRLLNATNNGEIFKTENFACTGKAHSLSTHSNPSSRFPIFALLGDRCPTAVFLTVFLRSIYAINGMKWRRFFSHIVQEVFKRIPSRANSNAFPAILVEVSRIRIEAPCPHIGPRSIFRRCFKSCGMPMNGISQKLPFLHQASATMSQSSGKTSLCDRLSIPADTLAYPISRLTQWVVAQYGKSAKDLSCSVCTLNHNMFVSHCSRLVNYV